MAGLACAGMVNRASGWAIGIFTLTGLLFAISTIRAIRSTRHDQAFATAFAAVGVTYLLIAIFSSSVARLSLPTNYLLALAARQLQVPTVPVPTYAFTSGSGQSGGGTSSSASNNPKQAVTLDSLILAASSEREATAPLGRFFLIGHCVWSWLLALLAGWFAVCKPRAVATIPE